MTPLLAILLLAADPAPTPRQIADARRARGDAVVDIRRDAGALADAGGPAMARNRRAIQAAIDSFDPALVGIDRARGTVKVPAADGPFLVDGPIFLDQSRVDLVGEGRGSEIRMDGAKSHPTLVLGIRRRPVRDGQPVELSPGHFVDLHGRLDRAACPRPGMRWGIRTLGKAHVTTQGTALDAGPIGGWPALRSLAVDLAIEFPGEVPTTAILLGVSERDHLKPFLLEVAAGRYSVQLDTDDGPTRRGFTFEAGRGRLQRVAFHVDLENGKIAAYVDGRQVDTKGNLPPKLRLVANDHSPFGLGASAGVCNVVTDQHGAPADWLACGLRLGDSPRYADNGPGRPQRRLDGRPIDDESTYFEGGPDRLASLPLADRGDRTLTVTCGLAAGGGDRPATALLLDDAAHADNFNSVGPSAIRDLSVRTAGRFGQAIALGHAIHLDLDRVVAEGGYAGLGAWNFGANFPIRLRGCTLSGSDAGLYLFTSMADIRDLTIPAVGRVALRLERSRVELSNAFVAGFGAPESIIKGSGYLRIGTLDADFEGGPHPSRSLIEWSNIQGAPLGGLLDVGFLNVGTMGPGAVLVDLREGGPPSDASWGPARLRLAPFLLHGSGYSAVARTFGPSWRGTVALDQPLPAGMSAIRHVGPGASGLRAEDRP